VSYVNKVILVGNLGADPEVHQLPNGDLITNIRVATASGKNKLSGTALCYSGGLPALHGII
jgi:hypothetical protein